MRKNYLPKLKWRTPKQCRHLWGIAILLVTITWSCKTTKCVLCDIDNSVLYNVELDNEGEKIAGKSEFETFFAPVPIETGKKKVDLYLIDCDNQAPYNKSQEELEKFIKDNVTRIDTSHVIRIVTTSDADFPPRTISYTELSDISLCNRTRKAIKLELRGMLGYRIGTNESISYPGENNGETYERQLVGFGTGGTQLTLGAEAAIIPRIKTFNYKHALGIGVLTGFWPVDGGLYVPIALHPRFTFNEFSTPLWGKCNAWYLFADAGTAYDVSQKIEFIRDSFLSSWFVGGGAGIDLWKAKGHDLSFDMGYRYTSLGLELNEDMYNCTDGTGTSYATRNVGQVFVRVGFTW